MVDKLQKGLNKLSEKERKQVKLILEKIFNGTFEDCDVKKLKSHKNIFRIRKGGIRIIFSRLDSGEVKILTIERRNDNTYNSY